MCRSVLLPLPDGPMMATASPRATLNEMSRRVPEVSARVGYDLRGRKQSASRRVLFHVMRPCSSRW
jgi:hypothetical protein